jgi:serine/threonine protein kinase
MLELRHPNVVKLYETYETKKNIIFVLELCPGGDLFKFVRSRKILDESVARFFFK